jgi:hypothetical protein
MQAKTAFCLFVNLKIEENVLFARAKVLKN